jgi:hypothetical protein
LGTGRAELTPDLLGDFAVLLNITADELEALTGVATRGTPDPELRRLTPPTRSGTFVSLEVRQTACFQVDLR